ncbi:mediator of DNA damage checkpoint protein 1 isoform X2 [Denticeps clupeoides]|uniref:mediator of DNA damage checkpoint protein 1 isoform X2 n=1 Tax=Denticeps clupeoides TaxID=299321 RepID=UPI0010A465E4|nr:mediator of DNA damage checkpoint protein 1 isoform X2 [Denticeps clupeoides]
MDATQAICDSDFYGDDEEEEENNDETNGVPVARLKLFKNNHLPETELPLYQGENVVGRDPSSCTVLLPARSMSKQHAIISISLFRDSRRGDIAMEALIWDLGSMNGTRKGRIKLTPHIRYALSEGEGLVLADLPCQYVSEGMRGGQNDDEQSAEVQEAGSKEKGTESDRTVENQAKEISTVEMSDSSDKSISLEQKEQSSVHIVPETDSDFDGKQGAFFSSNSDSPEASRPTCSKLTSPSNATVVPESPLSEMEETTTTGAAKPGPLEFNLDSDTDVEGGQDEVEAEVSQPRATNSKPGVSSTEGAAKPAERHMDSDTDVDEDVADGGSEKEPIDSGASNKAAEFHMDSDTDVEDECMTSRTLPTSLELNQKAAESVQVHQHPDEFHMDSDTDAEDESKTVSNPVVTSYQTKEVTASDRVNQPPEEFRMDSDTDAEDESKTVSNPVVTSDQIKEVTGSDRVNQPPAEFHMDSDTDAEDDSKTVSNPVVTSDQIKEVTASDRVNQPPAEFHMDSDTDAEDDSKTVSNPVVTSDQIKEVTGSDRVNQPPAEFHMDSDTDAEDESKTVSNPVVTSDQIKEVTGSDRVNQPPAEFHMDSGTDAEEVDDVPPSKVETTQAEVKSDHQMMILMEPDSDSGENTDEDPFKPSKSKTSKTVPLQESAGEAELKIQSDSDTEDARQLLNPPAKQGASEAAGRPEESRSPARQPADLVNFGMDSDTDVEGDGEASPRKLSLSSAGDELQTSTPVQKGLGEKIVSQAFLSPFKCPAVPELIHPAVSAEDSQEEDIFVSETQSFMTQSQHCSIVGETTLDETQSFISSEEDSTRPSSFQLCLTDRSNIQAMAAENTQAFSLPEERASDEVDSDLEATQAYGAASEQGGSGQAVEATQEYITHSDVDVEEVDKTPALDIIAAVMEKSEDEATQPTEYDPDYLLSTADTEIIHRSVQMEDKSEHNSDDYVGQEAKLCERSNDSDKEQVINSTESHLDVNFATSETQPICNTDDDYFEKAAKAESPKQRYRPLKGRRKREKAQPFQSFSDPQLSTAQTQPMSLFEEENGEEEGTLSLSEVSRRGGDKEAQEGPSTKPLEPSKRRGGKINDENNGEGEDENARILEPTRGKGPASKRGGRRRGRVVPEVEDELKDVFSRGKRKKRVMGLEREQDKQIANEGREILEENKCNQRLEKEKKEKEEREKVRGERTKQEEREREKKEREECLERERKEKEAKERMAMERKEKEERERIQRERKEQEEREREKKEREECLERERKEKEAKDRMAMERKEKEERERIQRERKEQEEREREKKEREEHLEREKKEKEAKEQMAMERKEKEEREIIQRERKEQEEREREKKEREECLERERKEKEAKDQMDMERKEKKRLEWEKKEREEQEKQNILVSQRLEKERIEKAKTEEQERLEREEKKQECLEHEREESERIEKKTQKTKEDEKLESPEERKTTIEEEKPQDEGLQKEETKTKPRGRRASNRRTAPVASSGLQDRLPSSDDGPARRTRSRSSSSNSVSSERSTSSLQSLGRGRGQRTLEPATGRRSTRRTVVSSDADKDPVSRRTSRSNSSNSVSSGISTASNELQNKGRGRGRGRKSVKGTSELKSEAEPSSSLGQAGEPVSPKVTGRRRRPRKTTGDDDSLDNDSTQTNNEKYFSNKPVDTPRTKSASKKNKLDVEGPDGGSQPPANEEHSNKATLQLEISGRSRGRRQNPCPPNRQSALAEVRDEGAEADQEVSTASSQKKGQKRTFKEEVENLEAEAEEIRFKIPCGTGRGRKAEAEEASEEVPPDFASSTAQRKGRGRQKKAVASIPEEAAPSKIPDSGLDSDQSSVNPEASLVKEAQKRAAQDNSAQPAKVSRRSAGTARQTHKVLFTGVTDEAGEAVVAHLGGSIAKGVCDMTHLVTDGVRRTVKFMCAVAKGIPVVNPDWLKKCGKEGSFMPADNFLVKDAVQEKKFNFCLKESLRMASQKPLLEGYEIHVTRSVKPEPSQMKDIITCSGARYLPKMPSVNKHGMM